MWVSRKSLNSRLLGQTGYVHKKRAGEWKVYYCRVFRPRKGIRHDVEARDTAELEKAGNEERMPKYISEFMKKWRFQLTIDWIKSEKQEQKMGVPQGSMLSVTLFAIRINAIAAVILQDIHNSLFLDDLQIAYSDSNNKQEAASSNSRPLQSGLQ